MPIVDAKTALRSHLKKHGISIRGAALQLNVTHAAVLGWLKGRSVPMREFRLAIERWSEGSVLAEQWKLSARERELQARAQSVKSSPDRA